MKLILKNLLLKMKIGEIYININNKNKKLIIIKEILTIISISIILPLILFKIYGIADITGKSMENTLEDNEKVIYKKGGARKGEIAIIKRVYLSVKYLVKRIIAVEGDTLEIKDNELYLNNEIVNEPYIKEKMESTDYNKIIILTGKVFVMGDNRNKSVDSRSSTIGLIDVNNIEWKVIFKLPFFNKINDNNFYII